LRNEAVLPVAQFLARAWSEKPHAFVVMKHDIDIPHTETLSATIYMPPPSKYPITALISGYRLWRSSLWHESMHNKYPPPAVPKKFVFQSVLKQVLNVIEDVRIEFLGLKEYPGMKRELQLKRAVFYHFLKPPANLFETYAQLMLFRAVKGLGFRSLPKEVVEAVRYTWRGLKQGIDTLHMARRVCEILGLKPDELISVPDFWKVDKDRCVSKIEVKRVVVAWLEDKKRTEHQLKKCQKSEEVKPEEVKKSEGQKPGQEVGRESSRETEQTEQEDTETSKQSSEELEEFFEESPEEKSESTDIGKTAEEILTPSEEIKQELDLIIQENERITQIREKAAGAVVGEQIRLPSKLDVNEEPYYDHDLILHLKAQLRKLRKGWKEISSYAGEFDVDSYVARYSKVFVDEERLKIGGFKVLILLDHSGSIGSYQTEYKKACIALAEALSTLNIPFAMYAFAQSEYFRGNVDIFLIKSFEEKWTRMNAKRLAQIKAVGGTPLATVYEKLEPIVVKGKSVGRGRLYFITLTDGDPDPGTYYRTIDMISKLKKHCKMIAIGFGRSMQKVLELAENMKGLGYERYVALDDLKKLPEKVLGLLGE